MGLLPGFEESARDILAARIVRRIAFRSGKRVVAQENERRHLPGLISNEFGDEFIGCLFRIVAEKFPLPSELASVGLRAGFLSWRAEELFAHEAGFVFGAGAEDAG
jgi:hypothetical protein